MDAIIPQKDQSSISASHTLMEQARHSHAGFHSSRFKILFAYATLADPSVAYALVAEHKKG